MKLDTAIARSGNRLGIPHWLRRYDVATACNTRWLVPRTRSWTARESGIGDSEAHLGLTEMKQRSLTRVCCVSRTGRDVRYLRTTNRRTYCPSIPIRTTRSRAEFCDSAGMDRCSTRTSVSFVTRNPDRGSSPKTNPAQRSLIDSGHELVPCSSARTVHFANRFKYNTDGSRDGGVHSLFTLQGRSDRRTATETAGL